MARSSAYSCMVGVAISLMLIIQFSSCVAAAAAAEKPKSKIMPREKAGGTNNNFIKISCQATENPSLCYKLLSPFESKVQNKIELLTKMALAFTIDMTNTTSQGFMKLAKRPPVWLNANDIVILRDCGEDVNLSLKNLKGSYDALISVSGGGDKSFQLRMDDINISLTGARTFQDTCIDEYLGKPFPGTPNFKNFMRKQVEAIKQLAGITSDLLDQYANTHKLHKV